MTHYRLIGECPPPSRRQRLLRWLERYDFNLEHATNYGWRWALFYAWRPAISEELVFRAPLLLAINSPHLVYWCALSWIVFVVGHWRNDMLILETVRAIMISILAGLLTACTLLYGAMGILYAILLHYAWDAMIMVIYAEYKRAGRRFADHRLHQKISDLATPHIGRRRAEQIADAHARCGLTPEIFALLDRRNTKRDRKRILNSLLAPKPPVDECDLSDSEYLADSDGKEW